MLSHIPRLERPVVYSSQTKVLHVNKIAGVPETLVAQARKMGLPWALKEIPAGRGKIPTVVKTRLEDLVAWPRVYAQADLIHLHYATNGYYGWGSKPFVLHLHGSDVRRDWKKPVLREVITHSLQRADAVLYATPDLYQHIKSIRPDAQWAPNPVPTSFFQTQIDTVAENTVVFSSRWDDTKGLELLLPLAATLISRGVRVVGIDWGTHKQQAREAGVELYPLMAPPDFAKFLASGGVVVGQLKFPALSMTDYQTLALNRPLVCAANVEQPPALTVTCEDEPGLPRDPDLIATKIMHLLQSSTPADTQNWVMERHHPAVAVAFLEKTYRELA